MTASGGPALRANDSFLLVRLGAPTHQPSPMPELPEVETLRRAIEPLVLGRSVLSTSLLRRDVLIAPGDPPGGFARQPKDAPTRFAPLNDADLLAGQSISATCRKGKQLALIADHRALVVQLGMTGSLTFSTTPASLPHTHALWTFPHGVLLFTDPRRFGGLRVFRSLSDLQTHFRSLGPDALTITPEELADASRGSHRPIKALLLDQAAIAGVGNIYADEALHRAGIAPTTRADRLTTDKISILAREIRNVLNTSVVSRGSTVRDFRDSSGNAGSYQDHHAVYGRGGAPCLRCGTLLTSRLVAQRTTVWCRACQPARPR